MAGRPRKERAGGDAPIAKAQEGMHRFLRRRSKEKEAQVSFLRALLGLRNPHPRVGERRGRGELWALPGGQAAQSKAILVTDPSHTPRPRPRRRAVRFPVWR